VTASGRFLGLDVGGTQVKAGLIDSDGERTRGVPQSTHLGQGAEGFLDHLAQQARALGDFERVGLGLPGVFRSNTSILHRSSNLPELVGVDLGAGLAKRLDMHPSQVLVGNDANLAAYGEQGFGAGRGEQDLLLITLGTGVGGGVVLEGNVVTGPGSKGGEIGHILVKPRELGGVLCGCGSYGCLETLVSANSAKRRAQEAGLSGSLPEICERARAAAGPERDLMHAIGRDLGSGLAYAVTLLDLSLFLVGGGFGGALDLLEPGALETLAERNYGNDAPRLIPAALGEDAGWIGAARLAQGSTAARE
jgi:glucokinase